MPDFSITETNIKARASPSVRASEHEGGGGTVHLSAYVLADVGAGACPPALKRDKALGGHGRGCCHGEGGGGSPDSGALPSRVGNGSAQPAAPAAQGATAQQPASAQPCMYEEDGSGDEQDAGPQARPCMYGCGRVCKRGSDDAHHCSYEYFSTGPRLQGRGECVIAACRMLRVCVTRVSAGVARWLTLGAPSGVVGVKQNLQGLLTDARGCCLCTYI